MPTETSGASPFRCCSTLDGILYGDELGEEDEMGRCFLSDCKISIMTVDETVHFYDISVSQLIRRYSFRFTTTYFPERRDTPTDARPARFVGRF